MPVELEFYDIPRERWIAAWALCVELTPDGTLQVNIAEFAVAVGVPTTPDVLDALAMMVHRYAEFKYGAMPRTDHVVDTDPRPKH